MTDYPNLPPLQTAGRYGLVLISLFMGLPANVIAAPTGANVVRGNVNIQQAGSRTTITATSATTPSARSQHAPTTTPSQSSAVQSTTPASE